MKSSKDNNQHPSVSGSHISSIQRPMAKYNKLSNTVRQITPGPWQCAMFCGGKNCKHDNPAKWTEKEMALNGLNSSWVGDNILAMARPSSEAIEKYSIVEQFHQHDIKSVINLQSPGEHSSCGNPLQNSGFSYEPHQFMDKDIFYYNFGWDDYGIRSLPSILDMVKVMSFALKQGKVAVHCHAGLGRTGVLIACYLMYEQRMEGDNAIQFVREKRVGAIQTPGQIECCQQFAKFLIPFRVIFSLCDPCAYPFTLDQFLMRQKLMLHGYEARELKYLPKIIHVVCNRLAELACCATSQQPTARQENMDILRKTAPGAFPSQRDSQCISLSPQDKLQSGLGFNEAAHKNKLPPLKKRSTSLENLAQDGPDRLGVLQPKGGALRGRVSPTLDMRRNMTDGSIASSVSSSNDDRSSLAETAEIAPQRNAQFVKSRGTSQPTLKSTQGSSKGRISSAFLRRSALSMATLLIHDSQDIDDVLNVGTAMAFDASSPSSDSGINQSELVQVLQSVQRRVDSLQQNLNRSASAWEIVSTEDDPFVLTILMWSWLEHLQKPFLNKMDVKKLEAEFDEDVPTVAFKILNRGIRQTLDCILKTVSRLPLDAPHLQQLENSILVRTIKATTHIPTAHLINDVDRPTREQGEDGEDDRDASLFHLLVMLQMYVKHLRSSDTDDAQSMCSQDSSSNSFNDRHAKNSPSKEARKKAPGKLKINAPPSRITEDSPIQETMGRVPPGVSPRGTGPRDDIEENDTLIAKSVVRPGDGLQRRKLRGLEKPGLAKSNGDAAPLPKKSALPPIF